MANQFTVLWDYDSMIYKAAYKVCSRLEIKNWIKSLEDKQKDEPNSLPSPYRAKIDRITRREWIEKEIVSLALNRLANMNDAILLDIEDCEIDIVAVEYYVTHCIDSIRKKNYPEYKATRKKRGTGIGKWVSKIRQSLIEMDGCFIFDDEYEADDLVKDRAVELGVYNCVICSMDKDVNKGIKGIHFDFYRPPTPKDKNGNYLLGENGFRKIMPCRGLSFVSSEEANYFFWLQMLMGDNGDNIKGIPRIGEKEAKKILSNSDDYFQTVRDQYILYYHNYFLKSMLGKKEFDKKVKSIKKENKKISMKNLIHSLYVYLFGEDEGLNQMFSLKKVGEKDFELHKLLIGLGIKHRP